MYKFFKKKISIFMFICSIFYLFLCLRPSLIDFDESYTLSLISHSYKSIIYLDSMDVHPPLYYFLLKFFINLTTFWTTNSLIKILSARLFSILVMIIAFVFLRKLTFLLNVSHNFYIQWVLLIILPNVLGYNFSLQQLTDIRMYSLAAMFIIIEFYFLLKFKLINENRYLVYATISAVCASYTHYYALMFSGILLLVYCIRYFFIKDKRYIKLLMAGIILIFSLLPWSIVFISQMQNPNTYWMSYTQEIKEILLFLIILILFTYPLIYVRKYIKNNKILYKQLLILISVIIISFIITVLYSFIKKPVFQYRYMFPIILLYEFLSSNITIKFIKNKRLDKYLASFILILLCLFGLSLKFQIMTDMYSVNSVKTYKEWTKDADIIHINKRFSKTNFMNKNRYGNSVYNSTYVYYISTLNKKVLFPKKYQSPVKSNMHIYYNNAYRKLFGKTISLISFKK